MLFDAGRTQLDSSRRGDPGYDRGHSEDLGMPHCDLICPHLEHTANFDAGRPKPIGPTGDQVERTRLRQEPRESVYL